MEINGGNNGLFSQIGIYNKQAGQAESVRSARFNKSAGTAAGGAGDTVSFSGDAFLLNEARGAAASSTDIRQDKVDAIKSQLANGTYNIDTHKIARGILSEEQGLL